MVCRELGGLAVRRFAFRVLDRACCLTHPIVHHRPWLWLPLPVCPLATLGFRILGDEEHDR